MEKIGVFISYNHLDKAVADAIFEALTSISPDLKVFIDHYGLEGGDEYEHKISESIQNSQWFIIVSSGSSNVEKNMNWCFYEAGQFRVKLGRENQSVSIRSRMCCLYDGDRLGPLATYEGALITFKDQDGHDFNLTSETDDSISYENTALFSLFKTIIVKSGADPLRDIGDFTVRKLMRSGVRRISLAFLKNRGTEALGEIVFQPRISFMLSPSNGQAPVGLTPEIAIDGEDNTTLATMFGINGQLTNWKNIKSSALSNHNTEALWVHDLEAAISSIGNDRVPLQPQSLCIGNDGNFYLPIVARYKFYRNGTKKCYVVFIPSQNKRFAVSMRSSVLLAGLILSIRFRQRILPIVIELKTVLAGGGASAKQMELLLKLQRELVAIETEAVEFGLPVVRDEHDEPPLLNSFREGETKENLRGEITKWSTIRNALFDKLANARSPGASASPTEIATYVIDSFSNMREINSEFIQTICQELLFAERVELESLK